MYIQKCYVLYTPLWRIHLQNNFLPDLEHEFYVCVPPFNIVLTVGMLWYR